MLLLILSHRTYVLTCTRCLVGGSKATSWRLWHEHYSPQGANLACHKWYQSQVRRYPLVRSSYTITLPTYIFMSSVQTIFTKKILDRFAFLLIIHILFSSYICVFWVCSLPFFKFRFLVIGVSVVPLGCCLLLLQCSFSMYTLCLICHPSHLDSWHLFISFTMLCDFQDNNFTIHPKSKEELAEHLQLFLPKLLQPSPAKIFSMNFESQFT
jgi:hypothetical protein